MAVDGVLVVDDNGFVQSTLEGPEHTTYQDLLQVNHKGGSVDWFVVTSHNMSMLPRAKKSVWGFMVTTNGPCISLLIKDYALIILRLTVGGCHNGGRY
jgi:hypothetical protein